MQTWVVGQAKPQLPQFSESLFRSLQEPLHKVSPVAHELVALHRPLLQMRLQQSEPIPQA
jgi:hypothetical protein